MVQDMPGAVVRELSTLEECSWVDPFFVDVWGVGTPPLGGELLRALAHAGGYVAGAFLADDLVGVSVGFLAHRGGLALHSHATGVSSRARGRGVGAVLKTHQRQWALDRGVPTITWTFDPLVRRNAWFNITKLGALPVEYLVDFYGAMTDEINGADESDRLFMVWDLEGPATAGAPDTGSPPTILACQGEAPVARPSPGGTVLVATPPDIEGLRRRDPDLARAWRVALRTVLAEELAGGRVVGFTPAGEYVVRRGVAG
jgi:predicted GNAT superfamily acetyltransferase